MQINEYELDGNSLKFGGEINFIGFKKCKSKNEQEDGIERERLM